MSDVALTICLLSLVAVLGLAIGHIRIRGISLGIGGVLFGGILVGHWLNRYDFVLNEHTLHFIQEFGLILFVYTIGNQVGPGFFASLRHSGLRLNGVAMAIVALSGVLVVALHLGMDVPLGVILGIFSGAVTNTPSLGAGQQTLAELGGEQATEVMGMGYAIAYPIGILGILFTMWLIRLVFRIDIAAEAHEHEESLSKRQHGLESCNVRITNTNLDGVRISDIPDFDRHDVMYSRLRRGEQFFIPRVDTRLALGDVLYLVGAPPALRRMQMIIGEEFVDSTPIHNTAYRSERAVVTNEAVIGKKIRHLNLQSNHDVVISRLNRAGIELVPTGGMTLQFGDVINLVGRQEDIETVMALVGNAQQKLQQVQMLPVFVGIGLGVLLGSIPVSVPGLPVALKLGLAGGPLVVAIVLARIGTIGKVYWFMPPSANLALREIGIVLFLSVVGLKAGGHFFQTLLSHDGLTWMGYGALITLIPLLVVGFLARWRGKLNYLTLCGLLAGSMTDPPALAFANGLREESGAPALAYATVYPLVMFLRIILPQVLAVLLWAG
ncbi:putative transporter [Lautropia dentalis]|jgi:putative transport protein HAPS_0158|uniref:Putative transporter n=1 Tax=Lautropia dentalis TaxID=2490857 RepID=A0A3R8ND89_9BURK|nr:putative transporter [Lautropia dentalis]RRN45961.1 putative transporter [Lautropia dentalis]